MYRLLHRPSIKQITLILIALGSTPFFVTQSAFAAPENSPAAVESKQQLPQAFTTARKGRVEEVAEGPYRAERESIRNWLLAAKKRGVGIDGYLNVYNDMENSVRSAKGDAEIKGKLERIQRSIGDQYNQSRKLQSPSRKVPKRGSLSQKSGKVDINYGRDRYWTPHEIKRSCEIAERNAIQKIPDYLKNDEEIRQDLRRQRDEREKAIMNRHGFRDRDFTRNPHRYKDTGRVGSGNWGANRYGN
jgi:hypothetical protein